MNLGSRLLLARICELEPTPHESIPLLIGHQISNRVTGYMCMWAPCCVSDYQISSCVTSETHVGSKSAKVGLE